MPVSKPSLLKSSPERQAELLLLSLSLVPPDFCISPSYLWVSKSALTPTFQFNQSRECMCCTNRSSFTEASQNYIHTCWCSPPDHELATCHSCHCAQSERLMFVSFLSINLALTLLTFFCRCETPFWHVALLTYQEISLSIYLILIRKKYIILIGTKSMDHSQITMTAISSKKNAVCAFPSAHTGSTNILYLCHIPNLHPPCWPIVLNRQGPGGPWHIAVTRVWLITAAAEAS